MDKLKSSILLSYDINPSNCITGLAVAIVLKVVGKDLTFDAGE